MHAGTSCRHTLGVGPVWPAGVCPSRRRSHAAAVLGGSLWVHGGLDSSGCHLADLWRQDLTTWQWQQLGGKMGDTTQGSAAVTDDDAFEQPPDM